MPASDPKPHEIAHTFARSYRGDRPLSPDERDLITQLFDLVGPEWAEELLHKARATYPIDQDTAPIKLN